MPFHIFGRRWVWLRFFSSIGIVFGCNFGYCNTHAYKLLWYFLVTVVAVAIAINCCFQVVLTFKATHKVILSIFVTIQRSISFIANWLLQMAICVPFYVFSKCFHALNQIAINFELGFLLLLCKTRFKILD